MDWTIVALVALAISLLICLVIIVLMASSIQATSNATAIYHGVIARCIADLDLERQNEFFNTMDESLKPHLQDNAKLRLFVHETKFAAFAVVMSKNPAGPDGINQEESQL